MAQFCKSVSCHNIHGQPNFEVFGRVVSHTKKFFLTLQEHWRSPEFPLARIKKIMRMDEDVKVC